MAQASAGALAQAMGNVMGRLITSAQQITRSAPSEGVSRAPLTYPTAALAMATSKNTSAWCTARCPALSAERSTMNASTRPVPTSAQPQKAGLGRWRNHSAATTAVASGSNPVTTAPWVLGTKRSARAKNSGNPTTTPSAVKPSKRHSRPVGVLRLPTSACSVR